MKTFKCEGISLIIKKGNLVEETGDAIVCPANSFNHMRGGVAGVIRNYGGDEIEEEAIARAPVPVGRAIRTTAGKLKVLYVIHAPTMILPVQRTDTNAVGMAVRAALNCADRHGFRSISFPGMGTGTGGVPYKDASNTMLVEIAHYLKQEKTNLETITIVAYSEPFYNALIETALSVFGSKQDQ